MPSLVQIPALEDMLNFETFNLARVLRFGRLLLGSEGKEYDIDPALLALKPKVGDINFSYLSLRTHLEQCACIALYI